MDHNDEFLRKARNLYACILASVMDRTMEEGDEEGAVLQAELSLVKAQFNLEDDEVELWWRQWGFAVQDTGGGCKALVREMRGGIGMSVMITAGEGPELPLRLSDKCTIGWYRDGRDLGVLVCSNSYAALNIIGEKG